MRTRASNPTAIQTICRMRAWRRIERLTRANQARTGEGVDSAPITIAAPEPSGAPRGIAASPTAKPRTAIGGCRRVDTQGSHERSRRGAVIGGPYDLLRGSTASTLGRNAAGSAATHNEGRTIADFDSDNVLKSEQLPGERRG